MGCDSIKKFIGYVEWGLRPNIKTWAGTPPRCWPKAMLTVAWGNAPGLFRDPTFFG